MHIQEILSIIALVLIGICLLLLILQNFNTSFLSHDLARICGLLLFVSVLLLLIGNLVHKDYYSDTKPESNSDPSCLPCKTTKDCPNPDNYCKENKCCHTRPEPCDKVDAPYYGQDDCSDTLDDKGNIRGRSWCCRPDKYVSEPLSTPYCDSGPNPYPHYDKNCEFQCTNKRYTVIDPDTEKPMAGKWS